VRDGARSADYGIIREGRREGRGRDSRGKVMECSTNFDCEGRRKENTTRIDKEYVALSRLDRLMSRKGSRAVSVEIKYQESRKVEKKI